MFKSIKIAAATLAVVAAIAVSPFTALVAYAFALPTDCYTQVPGTMLYVSPDALLATCPATYAYMEQTLATLQ